MHTAIAQAHLDALHAEANRLRSVRARVSRNTIESYRYDWGAFTKWCADAAAPSLPAATETVILYATDLLMRGRKISTVERHLSSISHYHLAGGFPTPCTPEAYELLALARRDRPLTIEHLRQISQMLKADNTWLRHAGPRHAGIGLRHCTETL